MPTDAGKRLRRNISYIGADADIAAIEAEAAKKAVAAEKVRNRAGLSVAKSKTSIRDGSPSGRIVLDWSEALAIIEGADPRPDPLDDILNHVWLSFHARTSEHDNEVIRRTLDEVRATLDAAGYVIVSKGEVRPELTVGRLAAALRECGWTPAMVEDEAAAILAALAAEASE